MIGAPNTRGQKYWVGIIQWAPETLVSEEIADIFRNHNIDDGNKCNDIIIKVNHHVKIFGLIGIMVLQWDPTTLYSVLAITRNNTELLSIKPMGINSFVQI